MDTVEYRVTYQSGKVGEWLPLPPEGLVFTTLLVVRRIEFRERPYCGCSCMNCSGCLGANQ